MLTRLALEPIKTALAAGDAVEARRQRLQLLRDVVDEMKGLVIAYGPDPGASVRSALWLERLVESIDTLGIPDE